MNSSIQLIAWCAALLTLAQISPCRGQSLNPADRLEDDLSRQKGVLDQLLDSAIAKDLALDPLRLTSGLEKALSEIKGGSKALGNVVKFGYSKEVDRLLGFARGVDMVNEAIRTGQRAAEIAGPDAGITMGMMSLGWAHLGNMGSDFIAEKVTRGMGGNLFGGLAGLTAGLAVNQAWQTLGQDLFDDLLVKSQKRWETLPLSPEELARVNQELPHWDTVLNFIPSEAMQVHYLKHRFSVLALKGRPNHVNWFFQRIDDSFGPVYYDYYGVRVKSKDGRKLSPVQYLDYIRRHFADFFPGQYYAWESYNYLPSNTGLTGGSVLHLTLKLPQGNQVLEDGAFVLSSISGSSMMLSSLYAAGHRYRDGSGKNHPATPGALQQIPGPYYNPFSGNRRFGYTYSGNGDLIFYAQGAFRMATPVMEKLDSENKREGYGQLVNVQRLAMQRYQEALVEYFDGLGFAAIAIPEIFVKTDSRTILQTRYKPTGRWIDDIGNGNHYLGQRAKQKDSGIIPFFAGVERFDKGTKRTVEIPRKFEPAAMFSGPFALEDGEPEVTDNKPTVEEPAVVTVKPQAPQQPQTVPKPQIVNDTVNDPIGTLPVEGRPAISVLEGVNVRTLAESENVAMGVGVEQRGVIVVSIEASSPASSKLFVNDIILKVDRLATGSESEFQRAVAATVGGRPVTVELVRRLSSETVTVRRGK